MIVVTVVMVDTVEADMVAALEAVSAVSEVVPVAVAVQAVLGNIMQ